MKNLSVGRSSFAVLSLLLGVALPRAAAASEEFPTELRAVADLECTPTCTVCHTSDPGTNGTATKPFAMAMKNTNLGDNKLVAAKPETVAKAYEALDPDGDGEFPDPADAEKTLKLTYECQAEIDYGCAVAPKPEKGGSASWWTPLLLSALGLSVYARRRRHA